MLSRSLLRRTACSTSIAQPLLKSVTPYHVRAAHYSNQGSPTTTSRPKPALVPQTRQMATMAPSMTTQVTADSSHFLKTSGALDPVWIKTLPYSEFPSFPKLEKDIEADVLIIGSGIAGVSIAYELVRQGTNVTMIEARDMLSGETGRTSGHLSSDLDDGYVELGKKHGKDGAKRVANSHVWALRRVGEVSKDLGFDCEYRQLKAYDISQYEHGTKDHDKDIKAMLEDMEAAKEAGHNVSYREGFAIPGWDGVKDQRDAVVFEEQATFHPTKYVVGVLNWLKKQSNFTAYSRTRATAINEKGVTVPVIDVHLGSKDVTVEVDGGHKIIAAHAVEATCVPLQRLSLIAEMEYNRTYCIAMRIPKGSYEDCLIYDSADPYKYVRFTECDEKDDYLVVGGCDHPVGQEDAWDDRYNELENWVRDRYTGAGAVDFKWSGQIFEPVDFIGLIGRNSGAQRVYVVTGDSGNGLTHGVLAGKLISDLILGNENPWEKVYDPRRRGTSIAKSLPSMLAHDIQVNMQYKRLVQTDIKDIEDLAPNCGGVLNTKTSKPIAVYKDENGKVHRMSALCPHMKGVVCWNNSEKSWDCPVHGSRFAGKDGRQICGPANVGLHPEEQNELTTGFMK